MSAADGRLDEPLGARLVGRRSLRTVGKSGAGLEEATLDGERVVVKWIRREDMLSQVLGGSDRLGLLWEAGLLDDLPEGLDHAMIGVERDGGDWLVVQRDVGRWLVDDERGIDAEQRRRAADGLARLHAAYVDLDQAFDVSQLATVSDLISVLHPTRLEGLPDETSDGLVGAVRLGHAAIREIFPPDVAEAVEAIARRPGGLEAELARHQRPSLIHGDTFHANLAFPPDHVVLLDWSHLLAWGTPVLDVAFFLAYSGQLVAGGNDALLADYRRASAEVGLPVGNEGIDLALLAALVACGWNKALVAAHGHTTEERTRELAALGWWTDASRRALDRWSP